MTNSVSVPIFVFKDWLVVQRRFFFGIERIIFLLIFGYAQLWYRGQKIKYEILKMTFFLLKNNGFVKRKHQTIIDKTSTIQHLCTTTGDSAQLVRNWIQQDNDRLTQAFRFPHLSVPSSLQETHIDVSPTRYLHTILLPSFFSPRFQSHSLQVVLQQLSRKSTCSALTIVLTCHDHANKNLHPTLHAILPPNLLPSSSVFIGFGGPNVGRQWRRGATAAADTVRAVPPRWCTV